VQVKLAEQLVQVFGERFGAVAGQRLTGLAKAAPVIGDDPVTAVQRLPIRRASVTPFGSLLLVSRPQRMPAHQLCQLTRARLGVSDAERAAASRRGMVRRSSSVRPPLVLQAWPVRIAMARHCSRTCRRGRWPGLRRPPLR
jgi:hypothetical protein